MPHPDWLWQTPQYLPGIGPKRAEMLAARGMDDIYDLMHLLPKGYRDFRRGAGLAAADPRLEAAYAVEVLEPPRKRHRRAPWRAVVADETGSAKLHWFSKFLPGPARELKAGDRIWIVGKPGRRRRGVEFAHPKLFSNFAADRIEPRYRGLPWLSTALPKAAVAAATELRALDPMPASWRRALDVPDWGDAICDIHAPRDDDAMELRLRQRSCGYRRLAADAFYLYFLGMGLRRRMRVREAAPAVTIDEDTLLRVLDTLPFALTPAQQRALGDVVFDLGGTTPMFRLVQGDVGSGKTAVALAAAAATALAGGQAALLAPTEILAVQHARFFQDVLGSLGLRTALLTGSTPKARRDEVLYLAKRGQVDVLVGTHALLTETVVFDDLRLVVIDEEQRYGVMQRAALRSKGREPHTLLLTATPIPRSLALGLLGETAVSTIDEKPPGRAPVRTTLIPPARKREVLAHIQQEIELGHQVFFLYPRVEDEDGDGTSVLEQHKRLAEYFGAHRVGLLHGRMSGADKNAVMRALRHGDLHILVATSVIEVGVDVPDATVLVIGEPQRFGLSQLHQLRGRIGRGHLPGACYLLIDDDTDADSIRRLEVLARTDDGFEIAEADLELRGPGSVLGTRQSGLPDLNPVLLHRFRDLIDRLRAAAEATLHEDPQLQRPESGLWRQILVRKWELPLDTPTA